MVYNVTHVVNIYLPNHVFGNNLRTHDYVLQLMGYVIETGSYFLDIGRFVFVYHWIAFNTNKKRRV
jgi:hypothetical protein